MGITIREATIQDIPHIVQLIVEMVVDAGETTPITEEYVERYLASPVSRILLAEVEGQVAGLLSYSLRPDLYHAANSCLVEELIVHEQARKHGVGGALLDALMSRLSGADCAEVSLAVMPNDTEAIQFYRNRGLTDEALFLERHLK